MFYSTFVSRAGEPVEVGSSGDVSVGGIPELVFSGDVGGMEHARTPFVVDVECVVGVSKTFHKVEYNKAVVDAVAVGRYDGGEDEVVVDDDNVVFNSVGTLHQSATESTVVAAGDETYGVVS